MAVVRFSDADVAVGLNRGELTLLGLTFGPLPSPHSLKLTAARVWNCNGDFSIAPIDCGLLQIVFSKAEDVARIQRGSPWIFHKFALCLTRWASPTQVLAESLARAPLRLQLWGLPFDCCAERLGSMLGTALGPAETAVLHQSESPARSVSEFV
ncbi:unnamed protein product [Linum trigynum]|uniref:DUF4283 domain-containing protein n=1 Tax=Linum trigynum TaxID=586398 RepID=A0AAV2DT18_9ROSI